MVLLRSPRYRVPKVIMRGVWATLKQAETISHGMGGGGSTIEKSESGQVQAFAKFLENG